MVTISQAAPSGWAQSLAIDGSFNGIPEIHRAISNVRSQNVNGRTDKLRFRPKRLVLGCSVDQRDRGGAMTVTQICIFAWAILGLVVVAILLRFLGRGDERGRENRN